MKRIMKILNTWDIMGMNLKHKTLVSIRINHLVNILRKLHYHWIIFEGDQDFDQDPELKWKNNAESCYTICSILSLSV